MPDTKHTADSPAHSPSSALEHDPTMVRWTVRETDAGVRADVVLGHHIPGLSRRQARSLARAGKLRVDGRRSPPSVRVSPGQLLLLELDHAATPASFGPNELEVLATTERLVYVAKPAGIHTVALTPSQPGVLATAVAARFPECAEASFDPREGGAVHRLDRPTSGVVAFARSRATWERARRGFSEERVVKHYLAVTRTDSASLTDTWPPPLPDTGLRGWLEPAPGTLADLPPAPLDLTAPGVVNLAGLTPLRVRAPLGRASDPKLCMVRLDGRRARTLVRPLAQHGPHVLVRLLLETGRRHQARVHLAWISLPILGDHNYSTDAAAGALAEPAEAVQAIHLHAFALDMSGVFPDEEAIIAPLPLGFWPPGDTEPARSSRD